MTLGEKGERKKEKRMGEKKGKKKPTHLPHLDISLQANPLEELSLFYVVVDVVVVVVVHHHHQKHAREEILETLYVSHKQFHIRFLWRVSRLDSFFCSPCVSTCSL